MVLSQETSFTELAVESEDELTKFKKEIAASSATGAALRSSLEPPTGKWIEGLTAEMPLLVALELVFRRRWETVLFYLPLAAERAEEDIEYVHQLRVASRRLVAVLDVLAEGLPEAPRTALLKRADKIRQNCGAARDLDVQILFIEELLTHIEPDKTAPVQLLLKKIKSRRGKVQKQLRQKLPKLEVAFQHAGEDLLVSLQRAIRHKLQGFGSFGQTASRILLKELNHLWGRAEGDLDSPQKFHKLRIDCKHLRYATEVFTPILHEAFREEFYPQLQHIQDLLGEYHDAEEAKASLYEDRRKWKRRCAKKKCFIAGSRSIKWPAMRAGLKAVNAAYAAQAEHAHREFLDLWPAFAGESFRIPVEEMLQNLEGTTTSFPRKTPVAAETSNAASRGAQSTESSSTGETAQ